MFNANLFNGLKTDGETLELILKWTGSQCNAFMLEGSCAAGGLFSVGVDWMTVVPTVLGEKHESHVQKLLKDKTCVLDKSS